MLFLSLIVFLPLAGAAVIAIFARSHPEVAKGIALLTTLLTFAFSLFLYFGFQDTASMQFEERVPWIPSLGISYHLAIDGISLFLVLLTTFFGPICILAAWNSIQKNVPGFMIAFLFLQTGMLGVFCSLDMVLFYVFWEAMLIPMYFLIGIWGGEKRIYAAIKFVLYTMAGGALMLVAILALYVINGKITGNYTFNLLTIQQNMSQLGLSVRVEMFLFLAFFLSFAIKVPLFPFHTWLPDAHVEAPTVGSVILAGVLLKMGTYGMLRFCIPLFPTATFSAVPWISVLAIIGIIYGALVAMVQPDLKKLVAYSSVSHLGFVVLGLFALNSQGIQGGILQMVNHGLSTGALFLIVGMIYERRHTRLIADFGGLAKRMPIFATIFMIITFSSIGLPGLNGFVGEFLVLTGAFLSHKIYAVFAAIGVILAAVYMLWMFQRVVFGKLENPVNATLQDLSIREIALLVPVLLFIIFIGVYPHPFLSRMEASVEHLIQTVHQPVKIQSTVRLQEHRTNPATASLDGPSLSATIENADKLAFNE